MDMQLPRVPKKLRTPKGKKFDLKSAAIHASIGAAAVWFLTWDTMAGNILCVLVYGGELYYQYVEHIQIRDFGYREIGEVIFGSAVAGGLFFLLGWF